jgi:hypothetical protein
MPRHRLQRAFNMDRLPRPRVQPANPAAFVLCPCAGLPAGAPPTSVVQELYRQAWEMAQAVVRPSLPERDLLGGLN